MFSNISVGRLLVKGTAVPKKKQVLSVAEDLWGDNIPLRNPNGIPTMVMTAARSKSTKSIKPFILRTYEYPKDGHTKRAKSGIIESSCATTSTIAAGATSAIPGVVDRIRDEIDGKAISFGDGGIFLNCPVAAAIDEARRLYPNRPLGVVLSIGYGEKNISGVIRVAKKINPGMHFHRIVPKQIIDDFSILESDFKKTVQMEERVRHFMLNDQATVKELDTTMNVLFSQKRRLRNHATELVRGSEAYNRRERILKDKVFQERCGRRDSVRAKFLQLKGSKVAPRPKAKSYEKVSNGNSSLNFIHQDSDTDWESDSDIEYDVDGSLSRTIDSGDVYEA